MTTWSKWTRITVVTLVSGIFVLCSYYMLKEDHSSPPQHWTPPRPSLVRAKFPNFTTATSRTMVRVGQVVNTPSCLIPDYDPYHDQTNESVQSQPDDLIQCNQSWPLVTYVVNGHTVRINESLRRQLDIRYCCYQQVSGIAFFS